MTVKYQNVSISRVICRDCKGWVIWLSSGILRPKLWRVSDCGHQHWKKKRLASLQWRHNERDGVSNHWHPDCLLNRLFRRRSKKTSKLHVTGLCVGNPPVTGGFPSQRASDAENVSMMTSPVVLLEFPMMTLIHVRILLLFLPLLAEKPSSWHESVHFLWFQPS